MTLIERIEGAEGPDRSLDLAISTALNTGRSTDPRNSGPMHYTASLDAAMTLARHDGEAFVVLSDAMIQLENDGWPKGEWAKTLPRYVAAAALKARGE